MALDGYFRVRSTGALLTTAYLAAYSTAADIADARGDAIAGTACLRAICAQAYYIATSRHAGTGTAASIIVAHEIGAVLCPDGYSRAHNLQWRTCRFVDICACAATGRCRKAALYD